MFYYLFSNMMYYIIWLLSLSGLLVFCSMRKHILITLLSLEYLVLCIFIFFMSFMLNYLSEIYFILIFLCLSVCEGVLGLSILVGLIRSHGNDQINSLSIMW